MVKRHRMRSVPISLTVTTLLLGGCSSSGDTLDDAALAQQLVTATQAAGVAPGLTVDVAESLYDSSAPQICDALTGGVGSAEQLLLTGNPALGRTKVITSNAVTYGGLVVQVYCPDEAAPYADLVADLDPLDSTN